MSKKAKKPKSTKRPLTVLEKKRRDELANAKRELRIERQITKHMTALARLVERRESQIFSFVSTIIGADYRIVPASAPAAATSERNERVAG